MYNMPAMTKNLLVINVLAFLATWVLENTGVNLRALGSLHFFLASDFHFYQFFTYMFLHADFYHILFNMFALWMFGSVIERVWGPKKFLFYYIVCGMGAGLVQELVQYTNYIFDSNLASLSLDTLIPVQSANGVIEHKTISDYLNSWGTIGASGAVYGILLAFGMIFPNERLFIIPIQFPIKAKWLVVGYIAIELISFFRPTPDGIAHMAHLGGMLFGFLLIRYWQKHPDSSQRYGRSYGKEFFDNLIRKHEQYQRNRHMHAEHTKTHRETDEEYNMKQRQNQKEIDAILDKIRRSGYDSLTKEEKQKLFEQRRQS